MNGNRKIFRPSAETIEKARIVKKFIEKKYTSLYEEEKLRKQYIDNLITQMKKLQATKKEQIEAQRELEKKEVEIWRNRRQKMKISDFTSEAIIGKGAFGEVRLCREKSGPDAGRLVAIKKMKKEEMIKKNQSKHVIAEREILAQADNKWIVDLHLSFTDVENLYLVMEYLPGGDLMNQLIKWDIFSEQETRFYMVELVLAIESVHKLNYIHRDIKPDNILLDKDGHIKLSDFGLCKYYENENCLSSLLERNIKRSSEKFPDLSTFKSSAERREILKKHHHRSRKKVYSMVGTIDYIAPEVFSKKGYTELVDWWSLGTIMFEMMVGYPPFVAEDAAKTCHKIIQWESNFDIPENVSLSPESEDLIRRLIENPDKRLGARGVDEIKNHPFFKGVNWETFANTAKPPHRPNLKSETDVSNFDDFDDDGTWVPAQSAKSIKRRGQQYEYESLFIGYSFKKEIDPMMNKHVESIVNELRRKKTDQMKRNASQEQISNKLNYKKMDNFKGDLLRSKFKKEKKEKIGGKGEEMEVVTQIGSGIFRTVDNSMSKRSQFMDGDLRKKFMRKDKLRTSKKVFKKKERQGTDIAKGPPKNLTSSKTGMGNFKKQTGRGFLNSKKSIKKKDSLMKKSPSKKRTSKKLLQPLGRKVNGKSAKEMKPHSKYVDVRRDDIINVYRQGKNRESTNSIKKKKFGVGLRLGNKKLESKREKTSREIRKKMTDRSIGQSYTDRDKKTSIKKFSTDKMSLTKKGFLKKYNSKDSKLLKKKYSKVSERDRNETRLSKKGSVGKKKLRTKKGDKELGGSKKALIKTMGHGFYPKKDLNYLGKEKMKNKNMEGRLYYSNVKSKGGNSSRYLDKKEGMLDSYKAFKMTNSQVKRTSKEMYPITKQYRSNIYDQ
jgi:serine/threonine kinase 38